MKHTLIKCSCLQPWNTEQSDLIKILIETIAKYWPFSYSIAVDSKMCFLQCIRSSVNWHWFFDFYKSFVMESLITHHILSCMRNDLPFPEHKTPIEWIWMKSLKFQSPAFKFDLFNISEILELTIVDECLNLGENNKLNDLVSGYFQNICCLIYSCLTS